MKKVVLLLLRVTSVVCLLGGVVLGFLARYKMGVQRSMVFRNGQLYDMVLNPTGVLAFAILGGFYFWLIWKDKDILTQVQLSVFRVAAGFLVLAIALHLMTSFLGTPWIMLGAYAYFMSVCVETLGERKVN